MLVLYVFYGTFGLSDTSWTPLGDPSAGARPEIRRMASFHMFLRVFTRGTRPDTARNAQKHVKRAYVEPWASTHRTESAKKELQVPSEKGKIWREKETLTRKENRVGYR